LKSKYKLQKDNFPRWELLIGDQRRRIGTEGGQHLSFLDCVAEEEEEEEEEEDDDDEENDIEPKIRKSLKRTRSTK
jgi:hypothetical protein